MIITKKEPFTKEEIDSVSQELDPYIKTVIDVEMGICSAGASRHFESEQLLLANGSKQSNLWGGGLDLETKVIDYNSFINIRPNNNNDSNEIIASAIRDRFKKLTEHFFEEILYSLAEHPAQRG